MPKEFSLLKGEKIIEEIKPMPALKWYFFIRFSSGLILALLVLLSSFVYVILTTGGSHLRIMAIAFYLPFFLIISLIVLSWILSVVSYNKFRYWITNKRVVCKSGTIGYQIVSIPYERISDVIISRNFLERLLGIASLHIQSLAGQISFARYSRLGSEGQLLAIPNPEEMQRKILELMRMKRKEEGLTI